MACVPIHSSSRSRFVFLSVRFAAKRHILQRKCMKGQIGTCLLGTRWYNFLPCTPFLESHNAQRYGETDWQTDGRHDDDNSRSYCERGKNGFNRTWHVYRLNFALSSSVSTVKDHRLSSAVQASRTLIAEHAWEQRAAMQILHDDRAFLFQSRSGMVTI